jgi:hypothetical protein
MLSLGRRVGGGRGLTCAELPATSQRAEIRRDDGS